MGEHSHISVEFDNVSSFKIVWSTANLYPIIFVLLIPFHCG